MNGQNGHGHRTVLFLSAAALVLATACTQQPADSAGAGAADTTPQAGAFTRDDVLLASAKVALPPASVAPADLPGPAQQAEYITRFCTSCHNLPSPAMHSATDWPNVLRRMWLRMGRIDPRFGVPVPEVGDRLVILDYLTANALQVGDENLPDLPGRQTFETTCSQCHQLADPRQHSPDDWLAVVRRMNQHMQEILGTELRNEQMAEIVQYLQSVSTG